MATKSVYVQPRDNETNIAAQITRIQGDRDKIRAKLVSLSLATSSDNLDTLATTIGSIQDNGAVDATVKEGESYTIPKGYHNGSGVVKGIAGGGNYTLQTKTATPTKMQQNITSDEGYYGLSSVTVEPIPETYQDVTSVTAAAADVLSGKIIVSALGEVTTGTMPNNGAVSKTLDVTTPSYTVPAGYHDGKGTVSIVPEDKSVTPTKSEQEVTSTAGKVLGTVTVAAIPENFIDTTDADAAAEDIKQNKTAYVNGVKVTGKMPVFTEEEGVAIGIDTPYTVPAGYHDGSLIVSVDGEEKTVTPTKEEQVITPTVGKAISKVTVEAIPGNFVDTSDATATADKILVGETAYVGNVKITGTMANNGATSLTIDGMLTDSVEVPAGYTSGGTVTLTDSIETALAAI